MKGNKLVVVFFFLTLIFFIFGVIWIKQKNKLQNEKELFALVTKGNIANLKNFLSTYAEKNYEIRNAVGMTPLSLAIGSYENKIAIVLLDSGANPNFPSRRYIDNKEYKSYPFYEACIQDEVDFSLLNTFIKHKVNMDIGYSIDGEIYETSLSRACYMGKVKLIQYLVTNKANVKMEDINGLSALDCTIISQKFNSPKEKVDIIHLLKSHGAVFNPDKKLPKGNSTMKEFVEKKLGKDVLDILESKQKIK